MLELVFITQSNMKPMGMGLSPIPNEPPNGKDNRGSWFAPRSDGAGETRDDNAGCNTRFCVSVVWFIRSLPQRSSLLEMTIIGIRAIEQIDTLLMSRIPLPLSATTSLSIIALVSRCRLNS